MFKTKLITTLGLTLAVTLPASASIISLWPNDTHAGSGMTATTPGLTVAGAPGAGANDNEWGFTDSNGLAVMGASLDNPLDGLVWVSRGDFGEDNPLLTTTISGLDDSKFYNIYFYQATNDVQSWGLQAGASGSTLTTYFLGDGVTIEDGTTNLEEVLLLNAVQSVGGEIQIDIDDNQGANVRGFYKGVGVEETTEIPEPASLSLCALGALCLIKRNKRA